MSSDILFERINAWGVVTLNRPEALNALNLGMVAAFRDALQAWERDGAVKAVLVMGAGEKAFCAGGDVRWVAGEARSDPAGACAFFREEYRLNALIHHYSKPYVALIDGIVMGGGVGVSVHGDFRVVGDRTLFAMPETGIGLFPDVGGGYFLPRLNDGLGLYYALTGARAKAADCMAAGIATHYVRSEEFKFLSRELLGLSIGERAHADIEAVLDGFAGDPGHAPINDVRGQIAGLFCGHQGFPDLWAALSRDSDGFGIEVFQTLQRMSPTSMMLTFEQLKRGALLDFDEVMRMEFRMVSRVMRGHDFFEGVRAVLIDKDKNPRWAPARVDDLEPETIAGHFAPLGDDELPLP